MTMQHACAAPRKHCKLSCACVQALADVSVRNGCVKYDKAWCEEHCADFYPTGDANYVTCLQGCGSDAQTKVMAFAKALSRITIETEFDCTNQMDPIADVWVTAQNLEVWYLTCVHRWHAVQDSAVLLSSHAQFAQPQKAQGRPCAYLLPI